MQGHDAPPPAGRTLACHSWDRDSTGPPRESRADSLEGFRDSRLTESSWNDEN